MSSWVRVERGIYRRGRVYVVRWDDTGRRQQMTVDTLTEARALRTEIMARKNRGQSTDYGRRREPLSVWWPRYQASRAANRRSTRDRDASLWRTHIEPALGDRPVGALTAADIEAWQEDLLTGELAPATVSKIVALLASILNQAVRDSVLDANPARLVRRVRIPAAEARFLEIIELGALEAAIDPHWQLVVPLMATTALRLDEVAGLRVRDVDLLRGAVRVTAGPAGPGGVRGQTKTAAGGRVVLTLPRSVCEALGQQTAARGLAPDDLLITGPDGSVLHTGNWRKRIWGPAAAAAGLTGVTPHALRHTAISIWLHQGVNAHRVARWAGHTSVATVTRVYAHLMTDPDADRRRDELGAVLERARAGQRPPRQIGSIS